MINYDIFSAGELNKLWGEDDGELFGAMWVGTEKQRK